MTTQILENSHGPLGDLRDGVTLYVKVIRLPSPLSPHHPLRSMLGEKLRVHLKHFGGYDVDVSENEFSKQILFLPHECVEELPVRLKDVAAHIAYVCTQIKRRNEAT